jgi:hypothetical protein
MNPPLCSSGSDTGGPNTVEERRFSAAKKPKPNRALAAVVAISAALPSLRKTRNRPAEILLTILIKQK